MDKIINKKPSVFIATFSLYDKLKRLPANGMVEPMLSFFVPRVKNLVLLDEPHPESPIINPIVELYKGGKLKKKFTISSLIYLPIYLFCKIPSTKKTRISYKLRDFFLTFFVAYSSNEKYDLFVGFEAINALAGIILKKLGKVKLVVYYVSDYSPTWFGETLFNAIYLRLDRFCVRHADFTWDVSPMMKEGRLKAGLQKKYLERVLNVQNGLFPVQIGSVPVEKRTRDSIVYMGVFDREMGIDVALAAFKLVLLKHPHATFHIIGGTKEGVGRVKKIATDFGIENSTFFYGFLPPDKTMVDIIKYCSIGVAPYLTEKKSRRKFGDPGKIRQYLGCGLPIVTTDFVWYGRYAVDKGAGIIVKDDPKDLADGICTLLENKDLYKRCSNNAIKLSKNNTWEKTYSGALEAMQIKLNS